MNAGTAGHAANETPTTKPARTGQREALDDALARMNRGHEVSMMQGIVKEKESEDAVYGKYWVVFTRPYTYENGACVGAHQIWRKKPDGTPPYAEVEYYSPENPARIPVDEIK